MKLLIINILILVIGTTSMYAQKTDTSGLFDMPFEEFLNVKIITSAKFSEKLLETSTPVNVITEEDIQLLNFNTLQEVLEFVIGMSSVNGEANFFTTTTIR